MPAGLAGRPILTLAKSLANGTGSQLDAGLRPTRRSEACRRRARPHKRTTAGLTLSPAATPLIRFSVLCFVSIRSARAENRTLPQTRARLSPTVELAPEVRRRRP